VNKLDAAYLVVLCALIWGAVAPAQGVLAAAPDVPADVQALLDRAPTIEQFPDDAVVIMIDEGSYVVSPNGTATYRAREVAKIMNERGHAYGEESITYSSLSQDARIIKARTIKSDGTVLDVAKKDIVETDVYQGFDMYADVKEISFAYPGVEDGCLVEYEYEIKTSKPIMPRQLDAYWAFLAYYPSLDSHVTITVPQDLEIEIRAHNMTAEPEVSTAEGMVTRRWSMSCPQEYEAEPYCPPYEETAPWIEARTKRTWEDIATWYADLTKGCAEPDDAIRAKVAELTKDLSGDEDKARAIFQWAEENVRYVAVELGESAYMPHDASEVFAKRYGDCKDMANLLRSMLKVVGIEAHLALIEPESEYRPTSKRPASPAEFSHCIAHAVVGGTTYWLDATAELCPFGEVPMSDRGCDVLVVSAADPGFVTTAPIDPTTPLIEADAQAVVDADGGVDARLTVTGHGDAAMALRGMMKYVKPDDLKQVIEMIAKEFSAQAQLKDYTVPDPHEFVTPVSLTLSFAAPDWVERAGDLMMLRPSLSQTAPGAGGNPFTKEERKLPFWFEKSPAMTGRLEVTLPTGYVVDTMPEDYVVDNEFMHVVMRYAREGDSKIVLDSTIYSKTAQLPVDKYEEVKAVFVGIADRARDTIVLKKA
jgi:transglutaminase-like putative cysteine protease